MYFFAGGLSLKSLLLSVALMIGFNTISSLLSFTFVGDVEKLL